MDETLPIGAHLVTPRSWYDHHGIYVGNGRVVHYAGYCRGYHAGPVEEVSLAQFERGLGFRIRRHDAAPRSGQEIAARARSRIGENGYRLLANNCEHFCEWCSSGRGRSRQVDRLIALPRLAARRTAKTLRRVLAAFLPHPTSAAREAF